MPGLAPHTWQESSGAVGIVICPILQTKRLRIRKVRSSFMKAPRSKNIEAKNQDTRADQTLHLCTGKESRVISGKK